MCIGNADYMNTTKGKKYVAYRVFGVSNGSMFYATDKYYLTPAFRSGRWIQKTKTAPKVSKETGGDKGLHSLVNRREAARMCHSARRVYGQVEVSGEVSIFGRRPRSRARRKPVGFLSTKQKLVKLYVRSWYKTVGEALGKRYKVPVVYVR